LKEKYGKRKSTNQQSREEKAMLNIAVIVSPKGDHRLEATHQNELNYRSEKQGRFEDGSQLLFCESRQEATGTAWDRFSMP